jgi:cell division protein FtsX
MDELGRALGELAREACTGVAAGVGAVRRRARRRVAARAAGGLLACAAMAGMAVSGWTLGRLDGGSVGRVATPDPSATAGREWPPLLGDWAGRAGVAVYLTGDVTGEQRAAIRARIEADDAVASVEHESREQAFARFKGQFRDTPGLVAGVTPEAMPESFRVALRSHAWFAQFRDQLCPAAGGCMPGVDLLVDTDLLTARILGGPSWTGRADAAVILSMDATPAQRAAVERRLDRIGNVTGVAYESPEQAGERLRRELPPDQLRVLGRATAAMPVSLRARLADPARFGELRAAVCAQPRTADCAAGVLLVIDQRDVPASSNPG